MRKKPMTIRQFAKKNNLKLVVKERKTEPKYYAYFDDVEIKVGNLLIGSFGNGSTKKEAINEYAKKIINSHLVVGAGTRYRVDLIVGQIRREE